MESVSAGTVVTISCPSGSTLSWSGTLSGTIKDGSTTIQSGQNYTLVGSSVTIEGLQSGNNPGLTFNSGGGKYVQLTVSVSPAGSVVNNGDGTATVSWSNLGTRSIELCTAPTVCPYLVPSGGSGDGSVTVTEGLQVIDLTIPGAANLPAGTYDIFLKNTATTPAGVIAQSTSAISIGGGGGTSSDSAEFQPVEVSFALDLAASGASCKAGSGATGTVGQWLTLPGADDCTSTTRSDAKLLGWSTSKDFPVTIAQRQVTNGWGTYELTNESGVVTAVFIPAGGATFVSSGNSLFPIWAR